MSDPTPGSPYPSADLEARLGHRFRDPHLLVRALTHRSAAREQGLGAEETNERLEFLGDAVIQLIVSDLLVACHRHAPEGDLSRWRSRLVCQTSLAEAATILGLGDDLNLGAGEARSGGREKGSLLCAVYEAVVGALYLDGGMEVARALVHRHLAAGAADPEGLAAGWDAKGRLQEVTQGRYRLLPHYEVVEASGPDHAPHFRVAVWLGERRLGDGEGGSKKAAEQAAAARALEALEQG